MTIGKKISELRKKEGLTQEKLAEYLKISRQTVSSWESGITSPDLKEASDLAKIFKVSVNDLTDNFTDVECKGVGILKSLIGKYCYIDADVDDYRLGSLTKCKVLSIDKNYVKVEFQYGKNVITKLLDIDLVSSFKLVEEEKR